MIDINSKSAFSDRVNWYIDTAIENDVEEPRKYLACSVLGDPCKRAVQYYVYAGKKMFPFGCEKNGAVLILTAENNKDYSPKACRA